MKKVTKIIMILITMMILVSPIFVYAEQKNNNKISKFFYIAEDNVTYGNDLSCDGDNSVLGNVNDENSVAWLLQKMLDYIRIIGPALVVILTAIEFTKVIIQSDDEAMAKAKKKLVTRLILVGLLFFIPTIVTVILDIFGITSNSLCNLQ